MIEIDAMNETLLTSLTIRRGRIVAVSTTGEIHVESDAEALPLMCDFLRTNAGSLPDLHPGDAVLYAAEKSQVRGYVLGVIQKYRASEQAANGKGRGKKHEQEVRELKFNASEKIELRCGESTMTMNKNGKIVMRGRNITSRAREAQKIKGATVNIN